MGALLYRSMRELQELRQKEEQQHYCLHPVQQGQGSKPQQTMYPSFYPLASEKYS